MKRTNCCIKCGHKPKLKVQPSLLSQGVNEFILHCIGSRCGETVSDTKTKVIIKFNELNCFDDLALVLMRDVAKDMNVTERVAKSKMRSTGIKIVRQFGNDFITMYEYDRYKEFNKTQGK